MSDTETFTINTSLDFGALGSQAIEVIGTVKECSISVTCLRADIRSVFMHMLAHDNSTTIRVDITNRLKAVVSISLTELLEKRYIEFKSNADCEPLYDYDVQVGIA